jgi:hypothetical protein
VVARLPQNVVGRILGRQMDVGPVIRDTADYDAYLAIYRSQGGSPGEYFLVFVDGALQDDQRYAFDTGAVVSASRLNPIEVGLGTGEGSYSSVCTSLRSARPHPDAVGPQPTE